MSEERDEQKAFDSVLKYLKDKKDSTISFWNVLQGYKQFESGFFAGVDPDDVSEILQELFLDGWFSPDHTQGPDGNWLRLTSYGRSQLELDYKPVFLDPVATIQEIEESIPNMDSIALDYFRESLWAIKKRLYLSATVTMGCASERSILLLIEAILDHYNDKTLISKFSKSYGIKKKFDLLIKTIKEKDLKNEVLSKYQSDNDKIDEINRLFVDFNTHLDQMFSIYRINRNDAGHPTGRKFNEDIVKATAAMFKNYCEIIYGLISHL